MAAACEAKVPLVAARSRSLPLVPAARDATNSAPFAHKAGEMGARPKQSADVSRRTLRHFRILRRSLRCLLLFSAPPFLTCLRFPAFYPLYPYFQKVNESVTRAAYRPPNFRSVSRRLHPSCHDVLLFGIEEHDPPAPGFVENSRGSEFGRVLFRAGFNY